MKLSLIARHLQAAWNRSHLAARAHSPRAHGSIPGKAHMDHAPNKASVARATLARPAHARTVSSEPPQLQRSLPKHHPAPSRTPVRPLISACDTTLHGFHHGPRSFFAEPLEAWLSVLADSVPLTADCLIICPASMSPTRMTALLQRARAHIPSAHIASLPSAQSPSQRVATARGDCMPLLSSSLPLVSTARDATSTKKARHCAMDTSPLANTTATAAEEAGEEAEAGRRKARQSVSVNARAAQALPARVPESSLALATAVSASCALDSPLQRVAPDSLDLVIFAGNVFGQEMLFDAPGHISLAHRALRPHGVLAMLGYDTRVTVVAPASASDDASAFLQSLDDEANQLSASSSAMSTSAVPNEAAGLTGTRESAHARSAVALARARVMLASMSVGHADVYLPFRGVRRRWFTSEYAMTPAQLASCYRAIPTYAILRRGEPMRYRDWLDTQQTRPGVAEGAPVLRGQPGQAESAARSAAGAVDAVHREREEKGDFVSVDVSHVLDTTHGGCDKAYDMESVKDAAEDGLAIRRACAIDSLEVLQYCLDVSLAEGYRANTPGTPRSPTLRVDVRHFALTCSNRSMNVTDTFNGLSYSHASPVSALR